ncbi:hypothetical protein ACN38_g8233 [Penicillium nordicum]|uniref:Uncharacterized protein n=1 Tax=Penicillium nordicum TaxID=229535 RepID=A0A0M8NXL3_9EURO|nr:hypothetical protein ACN38_g8233 [Penicillium nordicum]
MELANDLWPLWRTSETVQILCVTNREPRDIRSRLTFQLHQQLPLYSQRELSWPPNRQAKRMNSKMSMRCTKRLLSISLLPVTNHGL